MNTLVLGELSHLRDGAALAATGAEATRGIEDLLNRGKAAGPCVALLPLDALAPDAGRMLERLRAEAPAATPCLLASLDQLEGALDLAQRAEIGAVLPEGGWLAPAEWGRWLEWIARPERADFFGHYLGPAVAVPARRVRGRIESLTLQDELVRLTERAPIPSQQRFAARLVFEELLDNALRHAYRGSAAAAAGRETGDLPEGAWIETRIGDGGDRLVLSVADGAGALQCATVLDRLHRQVSLQGLHATSGRGWYLVYRTAARMLVRVTPGRRTEIYALLRLGARTDDDSLDRCAFPPLLLLSAAEDGGGVPGQRSD